MEEVHLVKKLMELLPTPVEHKTGRPSLHATSRETPVLLSLWTIGNQESFREIADRFGVGDSQAHRVFFCFCTAVCTLHADMIMWPTELAAVETMRKFSVLPNSFPDVIGCVDCTHVPVSSAKDEKSQSNRTSILLEAVCDSELRFTYAFAAWPGSSDDSDVWQNNTLVDEIIKQPELIPDGAYLLGNSAYPLSLFLMVPYKDYGYLLRKEENFNSRLSSTHLVIDQAFDQLFGRFRRLRYLFMFRSDRIANVLMTGCILHNLCLSESDETPEVVDHKLEFGNCLEDSSYGVEDDGPTWDAIQKRDSIADRLLAEL